MANQHHSNFYNLIKWISKIYITLERRAIPYPCKIIGIRIKNEEIILDIQFTGLTDKIELKPSEAINKNYFEYFSPNDKKKIFQLAYNKTTLKLSDRFFCRESNKEFIILTDVNTGHRKTLDINKVAGNYNLLNQLDPIDAHAIGFLSGMDYLKTIKNSL